MAGDDVASAVSVSLRLAAREAVLKREAKLTSWLLWFSVFFEVLTSYSIIIIPFLVNEYAYIGVLALLLCLRFAHEENLFKYLRRPALLLVGPRKSFVFNVAHPVTTSMSPRQWVLYVRFVVLALVALSVSAVYFNEGYPLLCTEGVHYSRSFDDTLAVAIDHARRKALEDIWLDDRCYTPPARFVAIEDAVGGRLDQLSLQALKRYFAAIECYCVKRFGIGGDSLRSMEFDVYRWLHRSVCGLVIPCNDTLAELLWYSVCKLLVPLLCIFAAPPLLLVCGAVLRAQKPNRAWLSSQAEAAEAELKQQLSGNAGPFFWSKAKLVAEISLVVLDMLLDVASIYTLLRTQQYFLSILQGAVVAVAIAQQLRSGLGALIVAVKESFHQGYRTGTLVQALLTEKMQESFWSVFIQAVAVPNLLKNDFRTALRIHASILSSMLGISGALYAHVHVCCDDPAADGESRDIESRVYGRQRDTE